MKTWSQVIDQLDILGNAMQESLSKNKTESISSSFDTLSSFISYISALAGIPPGSTPSSTTNAEIAKAYRRMITNVSKLGVSNDIGKGQAVNSRGFPSEIVTSGGTESPPEKIQMSIQEATNLVSEAKKFIAVYCQTLSLDFQSPTAQNLEQLATQDPLYEVQQSRTGAWTNDIAPAGERSLVLEPLSTAVPLDREVVGVLDYQRAMTINVLKQVFSLLDMKTSTLNGAGLDIEQFMKDRQNLLLSSLSSFTSLLTNMSNLVESIDLSALQSKRKGTSLANSPTDNTPNSLFLMYEFLQLKQTLYDDMITIITAIQRVSTEDENVLDKLAHSLAAVHLEKEESEGEAIKKRALEIVATIDSIVQHAAALAEEAAQYAPPQSSSNSVMSLSSGSVSHRANNRVGHKASASSLATSTVSGGCKEDWYLQIETDSELVYDAKQQLRGGTFKALVERLTQHNAMHPTFNTAMLLTYRSFTTPQLLFQELARRYEIQPPDGLSQEELAIWTEKKQKPIKQRVANVMKKWIEDYWYEDCKNKTTKILLASMLAFSERLVYDNCPGFKKVSATIENMLADAAPPRKPAQPMTPAPPSILPRNLKKMKIMDVDPLELARQLTLREYNILKSITPSEILNRRQRKILTRGAVTSNETKYMDAFIHNSNELTNWVASVILKYNDSKKRAAAIKYFVNVAEYCRQCNNFSSMMAIVSALFSATIHRMKRTWANVSGRTHETLNSMNKLMSSHGNFGDYRKVLRIVHLPTIPFFGVYLSDLTVLEDSQPDTLDSPKIINMSKRVKTAEIIKDLINYQSQGYNYTEVAAVQTLLSVGFAKAAPIDKQYETSLLLEPRERANERMARLLEETGYL